MVILPENNTGYKNSIEAEYSAFKPSGDQPEAIRRLEEGLEDGLAHQTLLGVTGPVHLPAPLPDDESPLADRQKV
jgi:hypothetical protein